MTPFTPNFFLLVMLLGWLLNIPLVVWILWLEAKDDRLRAKTIILFLVCSAFSWPAGIPLFVYSFIFPGGRRARQVNSRMLYWLLAYMFILIAILIAIATVIVNRFRLAPSE